VSSIDVSQEAVLRGYDPFARAALEPFGLPADAHIALLSLSENATYRIDDPAAGRTAVLRVHRTGYHPSGAVASELAWLQALRRDEGLLTPAVYKAADGRDVVDITIGDLTGQTVLFEWLPGTEPPDDKLTEKFEAARRDLRQDAPALRAWQRPPGFVPFDWDFDCCVGDTPLGPLAGRHRRRPGRDWTLSRAAALMADRLRHRSSGPDRFGLIHADVRLANLLADGDDIQVIDFDDCGFGWFMFDLATAVSFIEHDPRVPELCDAWVSGYRRVLPLPEADVTEIPTFVLLRRLQLVAWVGCTGSPTTRARARGRLHPGSLGDRRAVVCQRIGSVLSFTPREREMFDSIRGRSVPVTGGTKGIGKGIAAGSRTPGPTS
jgi:Ser/Thr protein kinase RdoA (MazF antagonist)